MNVFIEKAIGLPCLAEVRRYAQIPPFQNDGEVMYAAIAALLIRAEGDNVRWWKQLRQFAAQYNIMLFRQRELLELVSQSGWNAEKTIRECGVDHFIAAFIDTCLYDHQLQPFEYRLLHYFVKYFGRRPDRSAGENREQIREQSRRSRERIREQFASWRYRAVTFFERPAVAAIITILIILNAALLGLLTDPRIAAGWGRWLNGLDTAFLVVFTVEIACRLFAFRREYFKEPLNALDFVIILISWAPFPGSGIASAFRAFRVFRTLLLVNRFVKLKLIMKSLEYSLPNVGWVAVLLLVFYYVFAVLTTNLFGRDCAMFRSISASLLSLFQLMTLEGWPELVREVMAVYPWAWAVFIPFMLFTSYIFLNLVVGIVVSTMQEMHENSLADTRREIDEIRDLKLEMTEMNRRLAHLQTALAADKPAARPEEDRAGWRVDSGLFSRDRSPNPPQ